MFKQLVVGRFIENEVLAKIKIEEADLNNFFTANRDRYQKKDKKGKVTKEPTLAEVRKQVEQDYMRMKMQTAYQNIIEEQLASEDVEVFADAMTKK